MKHKSQIFFLVLLIFMGICLDAEIYYPWKNVYIGALENRAWAGLVFAPHRDSLFAFRIRVQKDQETAEGLDFYYLASEIGPHSPDGRYARVKFDMGLPFGKGRDTPILKKPAKKSETLILEWSRQDEQSIVGRIQAPKNINLQFIHYFPWNFRGDYHLFDEIQIKGESIAINKHYYNFWTDQKCRQESGAGEPELITSFVTEKNRTIYFTAGVGENADVLENHIYRYKNRKTIDSILNEEARRYDKNRVKINGLFQGAEKAITNNLFWMTLYKPGFHRLYAPAGRRWIFPKPNGTPDFWTIFEWDAFLSVLEAAVESSKYAKDILRSVLETQYPSGNIPNWRGGFGGTPDRSHPPLGAFVTLKLFQKVGEIEILQMAYPYLVKWHSFWRTKKSNGQIRRDGNNDGLLEWGSDTTLVPAKVPEQEKDASGKQRAMWESGQNDLPNWDEAGFNEQTGTMNMNCLDLNCLYALDAWCLAQIANVLKIRQDYRLYLNEYERLKELINNEFWDEQEGFYFDRFWDGSFSEKKAASNFLPLLAGIPDQDKAMQLRRRLLNEKEFWGEYVIPSISRDDPAFNQQQYWRGAIWPSVNYLVYQGLKAYGFDAVASEFARKSADLFLRSWGNFQLCPENYDSRTGEAGGNRYQSWGALLALIAVEEYIDFNPWEGFRFGILEPEKKGTLSRISIQGRHYDIHISKRNIWLKEEGNEILKANGGAVFRHFFYSDNEVSFEIKSLKKRKVKVRFMAKGKYQLMIDGVAKNIVKKNSLEFITEPGEHKVIISRLD